MNPPVGLSSGGATLSIGRPGHAQIAFVGHGIQIRSSAVLCSYVFASSCTVELYVVQIINILCFL